ncbi:rod shape-determining protein MreD [Candidatus Magnetomoraceae bacterium gMMP-15]
MIYFYLTYIGISLFVIIFQTTIIPFLPFANHCYDLIIPIVLSLAPLNPVKYTAVIILVIGIFMDLLSGLAFGLYTLTYIWIFMGLKWADAYVHAHSVIVLFIVVPVGVIIENGLFLSADVFLYDYRLSSSFIRLFIAQILLAFFTGPLFLIGMEKLHKILNRCFFKRKKYF